MGSVWSGSSSVNPRRMMVFVERLLPWYISQIRVTSPFKSEIAFITMYCLACKKVFVSNTWQWFCSFRNISISALTKKKSCRNFTAAKPLKWSMIGHVRIFCFYLRQKCKELTNSKAMRVNKFTIDSTSSMTQQIQIFSTHCLLMKNTMKNHWQQTAHAFTSFVNLPN